MWRDGEGKRAQSRNHLISGVLRAEFAPDG
jgi:hypothetical protein